MSTNNLFSQASTQVNFLLLAQRNMILVTAFALTLATFIKNFNYPFVSEIIVILFSYSIAVGIKSALDFNAYIDDVFKENQGTGNNGILDDSDKNLLNRWYEWVYFTYTLISIISIFLLIYLNMEYLKIYIPQPRKPIVKT